MINLLSYITRNNIIELSTSDREAIAKNLIDCCLNDLDEDKRQKIHQSLLNKKNGLSINLTKGFALVHARIDDIENIRIAVGILKDKISLTKSTSAEVIFCIVIPGEQCRTYLSLMAHLTRLLTEPLAKEVFKQGNVDGIIDFIRQFEEL